MFLSLDKDSNGTLSKQELREYADGTLTDIFIERGKKMTNRFHIYLDFSFIKYLVNSQREFVITSLIVSTFLFSFIICYLHIPPATINMIPCIFEILF